MAYLVTGGAGFIGSHLTRKLLERGDEVIILDNFNDTYDPKIKLNNVSELNKYETLTLIEGDVRDAALLAELFDNDQISHIAHLAAMANVRASVNQAPLYMDVNLTGTLNILETAAAHEVQQIVLASTSSVYGATQTVPFVETDAADKPLAPYPASKRSVEILAHSYHHLHDMNITVLRFFNVYGPAGRPDMMPMRLMHATQNGTEIPIFNGGDIHRDWTYIGDTINGVLAALQRPLGYEIINLGCGSPISLKDFVDIIEALAGKPIHKIPTPTPASDPPITYCDNQKARQLLDFNPRISVQDGLKNTWDWFIHYHGVQSADTDD